MQTLEIFDHLKSCLPVCFRHFPEGLLDFKYTVAYFLAPLEGKVIFKKSIINALI